jgi:hypothetical protein
MQAFSNALADLADLAAQRWLMFGVAGLLAAILLMAFVNTLQENMRHGEAFRQSQHVSSVRQTISTVADAAPAMQTPQLR